MPAAHTISTITQGKATKELLTDTVAIDELISVYVGLRKSTKSMM
jgi:hypothetical protein